MLYKNMSCSVKTFYGVEFKPGETKEVPGYINHREMIVATNLPKEETSNQPRSTNRQKKSSDKPSVIQEVKPEATVEEPTENDNNEPSSSKD